VCLTAAGQPPAPPKLAAARADYQKTLDKAKAAYDESLKQAASDYRRRLTTLLDEETKAGKLDTALAVRDEIKGVDEGGRKVATKADLKRALAGSRWAWDESPLVLQADGVARHAGWEANKLTTRWDAIDRRTVILVVEKGRDTDRIAVLEFTESLEEYRGIDHRGVWFERKRRLAPAAK
jgi:hypothetical protein